MADELRIGLQELLRKAQMEGITGGVCRTSESAVNRKFNFGEFPFHAVSILENGCGRRLGLA